MSQSNPISSDAQALHDRGRSFGATRGNRWSSVAWLILLSAVAAQGYRIFTVRSATGEVPFHSANDRSRWCAVAAIVEKGQFEIDEYLEIRSPTHRNRRPWATIDLVRHRGRDGKQHYYSSKPPLLSVIHASAYALLRSVTGLTLTKQTFATAQCVLVLVNLIPLALSWCIWLRYWESQSITRCGLVLLTLFMTWGTFVSTFANTLNNHLPGAVAAGVSLWAILKAVEDRRENAGWYILACAASAMCVVCELPALAWAAATLALLVQINLRKTLVGVLVGMLPFAIAFAAVNYAAHGDLRPPYAHRAAGPLITTLQLPAAIRPDSLAQHQPAIVEQLRSAKIFVSPASLIRNTRTPGVQELWDEENQLRFAIVLADRTIAIHHWDDWYDYPNSYWYPERKRGVDRGEASRALYIFHCLFGHHGVFSLTPMWLLIPIGAICIYKDAHGSTTQRLRSMRVQVMLAILATTLVCFAFYMARPLEDRNYGGVSSGFRWMFWFTPLWLWLVGQSLRNLRTAPGVVAIGLLTAASLYSANAPWSNPWTTPWLTALFPLTQ